jgi:hypothetical protein
LPWRGANPGSFFRLLIFTLPLNPQVMGGKSTLCSSGRFRDLHRQMAIFHGHRSPIARACPRSQLRAPARDRMRSCLPMIARALEISMLTHHGSSQGTFYLLWEVRGSPPKMTEECSVSLPPTLLGLA